MRLLIPCEVVWLMSLCVFVCIFWDIYFLSECVCVWTFWDIYFLCECLSLSAFSYIHFTVCVLMGVCMCVPACLCVCVCGQSVNLLEPGYSWPLFSSNCEGKYVWVTINGGCFGEEGTEWMLGITIILRAIRIKTLGEADKKGTLA